MEPQKHVGATCWLPVSHAGSALYYVMVGICSLIPAVRELRVRLLTVDRLLSEQLPLLVFPSGAGPEA